MKENCSEPAAASTDAGEAGAEAGRPEAYRRVCAELAAQAHPHPALWLERAARTAQEAAELLGVEVGQIAKSVIFRRRSDGLAVLVVTSGDRRVDEEKVAARVGPIGRADAEFVKAHTGFSIGGVSPVAHVTKPLTLIDCQLFRFAEVWAAAGHPNAVFKASAHQLQSLAKSAPVADVTPGDLPPELRQFLSP